MIPRATYRLQFGQHFGFADAAAIAPYLAELGVSHVYASPYLRARPGSEHGYDVTDHNSLNPELGDAESFQEMVRALRENGLEQILDYVPNHMGVGGADNPLWLDVLEFGKDSQYAQWFDVDWEHQPGYLADRLLIPFLGQQYGMVLEEGQIELRFDVERGEFSVWLYDKHKLPVAPETYPEILPSDTPQLTSLSYAFGSLPPHSPELWSRVRELKCELADLAEASEEVRRSLEASLGKFRGTAGNLESWNALDKLIQKQHWRPTHFRVAADDINYRRFFNINELAGIRMELPEVFHHMHRLVFELLRNGSLQGLRIDHVDGLYDPKEYLTRLCESAGAPFYLLIEKILESYEELRSDWPIAGTTGYDFCGAVTGLLVDGSAEEKLTRFYEEFTGEWKPFPQIARESKLKILENEMASELESLARAAVRIARQNPKTQDFTLNILRRALKEIFACFPVYRTYVDKAGAQEADERYIHWALAQARKNEEELDPSVFDFLEELLKGRAWQANTKNTNGSSSTRFAMKAQQFSGPVMAKGLEDTALYRYNRFAGLNEVGSSPDQFGMTVSAFHKQNQLRAEKWPHAMLATATHDTKHGEDARARLAAISLVPEEWATRVTTWSRLLRARRGDVERSGPPAPNDEYLFYQNLVASWPAELIGNAQADASLLSAHTERLIQATTKSLREARVRSNWVAPDANYEGAVAQFIRDALDREISATFLETFLAFEGLVARMGVHNSLVQLVLKATSPGVPDFYQGNELWDLNLVDPDNRRPVDFAKRQTLLRQMEKRRCEQKTAKDLSELLENWQSGEIKLTVTHALLRFRKENEALLAEGRYEPLLLDDAEAKLCCFWRKTDAQVCLVATALDARLRAEDYCDKGLNFGSEPVSTRWRDVLTERVLSLSDGQFSLSAAFEVLPAAILVPAHDL